MSQNLSSAAVVSGALRVKSQDRQSTSFSVMLGCYSRKLSQKDKNPSAKNAVIADETNTISTKFQYN